MKIVALEEHMVTPAIVATWADQAGQAGETGLQFGNGSFQEQLLDLGDRRRADMADMGVDVQVISVTSPGVQNLRAGDAVPLAREANDLLAAAIATDPAHFQGFATLPTPDPVQAAAELGRAVTELGFLGAMVNGRTGEKSLDHRDFDDLYDTAARLHAPLYLHPQLPDSRVRDAYYTGIGPVDAMFSGPGIGWHYETGMQLLRMVLAGTFDRHPDLQVIVGHWGEVVLFYLDRIGFMERVGLDLQRPIADYFATNVSYTGSGVLSDRYLRWAIEVVGVDRILYAADYPFVPEVGGGEARRFLAEADLSDAEKEAIGHGNWERLTANVGNASAPAGGTQQ